MVAQHCLFLMFGLLSVSVVATRTASRCGQPKHIHLAVGTDSSTSMTVSFSSSPCKGDPMKPSGAVMIGTSKDRTDRIVVSADMPIRDEFVLFPDRKGRSNGNYTSDYYHHIQITGLEPNQKYYYRCLVTWGGLKDQELSDAPQTIERQDSGRRMLRSETQLTIAESEPRFFWTAPAPGQGVGPTRPIKGILKLAILGDLGYQQRGKDTMATLSSQRDEISAVLLAGDIAYPRSRPEGWDEWFDAMESFPAFSELPIQIAAGNHDIEARRNGDVFMDYENRFYMPKIKAPETRPYKFSDPHRFPPLSLDSIPYPLEYDFGNSFYSFVYGPTHNVVINSYANFNPGSNQYKWLVSELGSVNRSLTPWLFVTMHVPIYNTYHVHHKDIQLLMAKEHLEALFIKHQVNIVFSGHVHAYLRTHPVVHDELNSKGPIHIVVGDGGRAAEAPFKCQAGEEWVAARDATYFGYGTIEILNHTHLQWEWVHSARNDDDNRVWHPRPKVNQTFDEITSPPVEHDSAIIQNQYFL